MAYLRKKGQVSKYLDPAVVSRLGNMDLKARLIVEGYIAGLHRSPYHGFSVEFAEYRQYMQGISTPLFPDMGEILLRIENLRLKIGSPLQEGLGMTVT